MNVVVTGGGTVAPIDDVRHIANLSTGRFSTAISEACLAHGASVWHIHAPGALLPFEHEARLDLTTRDLDSELARLRLLHARRSAVGERLRLVPLRVATVDDYADVLETTLRSAPIDVAFLSMAVSDYEPERALGKLDSSVATRTIRCVRTPKVIDSVRDWSPSVYLVGFKLTSGVGPERLVEIAEESCRAHRADAVVANDLSSIERGRHTVHFVRPGAAPETFGPDGPVAARLVERVLELASARGPR